MAYTDDWPTWKWTINGCSGSHHLPTLPSSGLDLNFGTDASGNLSIELPSTDWDSKKSSGSSSTADGNFDATHGFELTYDGSSQLTCRIFNGPTTGGSEIGSWTADGNHPFRRKEKEKEKEARV